MSNGLLDSPKDAAKVRAGAIGARVRWGEGPRTVRIADLTPPQRRLVLALVDAARMEATAEVQSPAVAEPEGHSHDRPAA